MDNTVYNEKPIFISFVLKLFLLFFLILPSYVNSAVIVILTILYLINRRHLAIKIESISIILFTYLLLNIISTLYATNIGLALKETMTWLMFLGVVGIFKKNSLKEQRLYRYLIAGGVLANILFLVKTLSPIDINLNIPTYNCLAMINCILIIYIENLIQLGIVKKVLFFRTIQGLLLLSIIVSAVRGIFAIVMVYYVYYVIYKQNRIKRLSAFRKIINILCILFLGGIVLYFLNSLWTDYTSQMRTIFSGEIYSNQVRLLLYKQAIEYSVKNSFLFGAGAGNFIEVYNRFGVPGFHSNHAHSIFLQPFVELGVIGAIIMIALFFLIIKKSLSLTIESKLMYLEIVLPFLIYGMVDYTWVDLRVGIVFFIFVGQIIHAHDCKQFEESVTI